MIDTKKNTIDDWRAAVKAGDYLLGGSDEEPVFLEVLDPLAFTAGEEVEQIRRTYARPGMRNVRFARGFSDIVPKGELGDIDITAPDLRPITKAQFEALRAAGWPNEPKKMFAVAGIPYASIDSMQSRVRGG